MQPTTSREQITPIFRPLVVVAQRGKGNDDAGSTRLLLYHNVLHVQRKQARRQKIPIRRRRVRALTNAPWEMEAHHRVESLYYPPKWQTNTETFNEKGSRPSSDAEHAVGCFCHPLFFGRAGRGPSATALVGTLSSPPFPRSPPSRPASRGRWRTRWSPPCARVVPRRVRFLPPTRRSAVVVKAPSHRRAPPLHIRKYRDPNKPVGVSGWHAAGGGGVYS